MRTLRDLELVNSKEIFSNVIVESHRQVRKWGVQNVTPAEWMLYLTEEVGELAEAIAEREYRTGTSGAVYKEAIQVATLALKLAEMYGYD